MFRIVDKSAGRPKVVQSAGVFFTVDDAGEFVMQVSATPRGGPLHELASVAAQAMYSTIKEEWEKRKTSKK